jgi:RHH-type proline utilization regulon transcriptional repressor/proline dehydrogenase/delta 1-pyrroline-5-carboxylate dehydrogenase
LVKRIRAWRDGAEHFGRVVLRARDFEHALELANQTDAALMAGIVSCSPSHIERASANLRGTKIYVNRAVTGSVVEPKADGQARLSQFVHLWVVTENTLRRLGWNRRRRG